MAVLTGEGRVSILYGMQASPLAPHRPVYLARPDAVGHHPGVIIAHDGFEPTPPIKDLARRLARYGFAAAVPEGTDREVRAVLAGFDGGWSEWSLPGHSALLGIGRGVDAVRAAAGVRAVVLLAPHLEDLDITGEASLLVLSGSPNTAAVRDRVGRGTWVTYPGVGDRFWDDHSADFQATAATDAFDRIVAFLDAVLAR